MKKMALLFLSVLMIFAVIGCSSQQSTNKDNETESNESESNKPTGKPQKGGSVTVGVTDEPNSLDPHNTGEAAANIIMGNIGASLVFQNPETKEFEPYLAKEWKTSKDGLTWTFKLRKGVTFHNGKPLTAEDFVKTYKRAKESNQVASSNLKEVKSITAPDKYTLVLKLKQPFAPLLQYLSDPGWLQPLPAETLAKKGEQFGRNPVGVGPWKFKEWKNGQSITLVRYENYNWAPEYFKNQGAVYPKELVYKFITETQTKLAALESGTIDIAAEVPANEIKKYKEGDGYNVLERPRNGLGLFTVFNMENSHLENIEVRKAINYAVNKEAMVKSILFGEGEVAYGPLPSSFFGYDPSVEEYAYHYNVEKAKELLESAGYVTGDDGIYQKNGNKLELDLMTKAGDTAWTQAATLVQAMLKQVGIKVNVVSRQWGTLLDSATKHQFDMTLMGYTYTDPDVLSLFLRSTEADGGLNLGSVKDTKLDKLLQEGRSTVNQEQRKEVYAKLQKHIVENAYWAPLYTEKQFFVVSERVQNVSLHPLLNLLYQDSWVKQ